MLKDSNWKCYFPEDGETADDAIPIQIFEWRNRIFDEEDAAEQACEMDHDQRDGWERRGEHFKIVVIDPDGKEYKFYGYHDPAVIHRVYEDDDDESKDDG